MHKHGFPVEVDEGLISLSRGFSGAEIEQAFIDAAYESLFRGTPISSFGIKKALKSTIPLSITMEERIETLRRWAGTHARSASCGNLKSSPSSNLISLRRWEGRQS